MPTNVIKIIGITASSRQFVENNRGSQFDGEPQVIGVGLGGCAHGIAVL